MNTFVRTGVVAHAFNPNTLEIEAGGSRLARVMWQDALTNQTKTTPSHFQSPTLLKPG